MATLGELLQKKIQEAVAGQQQQVTATKEAAAANQGSIETLIGAVTKVSEADAVISDESSRLAANLQASKQRVREAAGGEERLVTDIQKLLQGTERVQTITDEVVRKRNRNIFDLISDPIGTVKDAITLPQSEGELQGAVMQSQAALTGIEARHKALTYGAQEVENFKITTTAAMAAAQRQKIDAARQAETAKLEMEGRKYNLAGINAVAQADNNVVQLLGTAVNAEKAEQQLRMQLENMRMDREKFAFAKAQAYKADAERAAAKKEALDEITWVSNNIRAGMIASGMTPPADDIALKMQAKVAISNPNSPAGTYLAMGMRNNSVGGRSNLIAATPSEYVDITTKVDVKLPETMKSVSLTLQKAQELLQKPKPGQAPVDRRKDPAAWGAAFDANVEDLVKSAYAEVVPGSGTLADFGANVPAYINASPDLRALPVTTKFLAPYIQTGGSTTDPRVVLKAGLGAVKAGTISTNELIQGMSQIYAKSAQAHVEATRMNDVGIIPPKQGRSYNVRMPSGFMGDKVIDLTNGTELGRWVSQQIGANAFTGAGAAYKATSPFGITITNPGVAAESRGEAIKRMAREKREAGDFSYPNAAN